MPVAVGSYVHTEEYENVTRINEEHKLETLLLQLQESLLTHGRSVQIAFHIFEILSSAGCDDEFIEEVSEALSDIVA